MRLLLTSDLHYKLRQYDWLIGSAARFDVVVVAGDHIDAFLPVPSEVQIAALSATLTAVARQGRLLVCSGNHDLNARNGEGELEAVTDGGLDRVNISLDSLDPERYRLLTRGGSLESALEGVEAAVRADLSPVKLNVVMMPDLLGELPDFVALTRDKPLHVRFIEWMPVGGCGPRTAGDSLTKAQVMNALQMLGELGEGELSPVASPAGWGPAHYFSFPGHQGTLGFIGSMSDHFCSSCNRLRLTADGRLKNCLFSDDEIDVKPAVRARGHPPRLGRQARVPGGIKEPGAPGSGASCCRGGASSGSTRRPNPGTWTAPSAWTASTPAPTTTSASSAACRHPSSGATRSAPVSAASASGSTWRRWWHCSSSAASSTLSR